MYEQRVGGWLTWGACRVVSPGRSHRLGRTWGVASLHAEDVQKARVAAVSKLGEAEWGTPAEKRFALRDAAAISLLSLIPPDRVGCIRKAVPTRSNDRMTLALPTSARPSLDARPFCACARAQLRLGHTLKKKAGGGWKMDLSKQRDGHKTSRFCIHAARSHAMPAHARACP